MSHHPRSADQPGTVFVLGLTGAKLGRLRELHGVGFVLLSLAATLERIRPLLDTLRSLRGFAP